MRRFSSNIGLCILHTTFDDRQEFDYKDLIEATAEDASEALNNARDFFSEIKRAISSIP